MAVETNARIEFSVASVEEWEKVNPKLHQGEPVFAKKTSGKYILKVGAPGGSTYKNAVVVWDQDDAETKMTSTQEAAAQALAFKNAASSSASAAKASENAAATSKSAAATSAENAKTSETNAAASKTAAANSASTASVKATVSANSASAAATSESNALKSASAAATSESNALKSASAAATSAGNAKSSETNASASASSAKESENIADASKSAAATSASNAKTSETNAAASANTAKAWSMSDSSPDGVTGNKSSKTWSEEAKTFAGNSAASASASQSSATASASASTNAANSASVATQKAAASANSASEAASSASNAKVSETNAANSASAAAQSAKDAATFDPSTYYSKTEVDEKIPTKTSQLTNDSDFANTAALEAEAKKWKNAYNNLRKRSVPAVFDSDEMTPLINQPTTSQTITLSKPYTDFDGLWFDITGTDNMWFTSAYISSAELTRRKEEGIRLNAQTFILFDGNYRTVVNTRLNFTSTTFTLSAINCKIQNIYGVKFKAIT